MFYLANLKDSFWYPTNDLQKELLNIIFVKDNIVYYKVGDTFIREEYKDKLEDWDIICQIPTVIT